MPKTGNIDDGGRSWKFFESIRGSWLHAVGADPSGGQPGAGDWISVDPTQLQRHRADGGGENLLPDIRQFLQANATLENKIQAVREQQEESIRVAAYASIAMYWMPEILYRFRRICPNVDVDLRMVDHALEPFELLQSGKTDVIFASRQKEPKCEWIPLYHELLYAILPKQYPLKWAQRISAA